MVVGQWIGLVVDRDKGLYPVTAVVVQRHRQPLHLRVFLLQGVQELVQLLLQRALFLKIVQ